MRTITTFTNDNDPCAVYVETTLSFKKGDTQAVTIRIDARGVYPNLSIAYRGAEWQNTYNLEYRGGSKPSPLRPRYTWAMLALGVDHRNTVEPNNRTNWAGYSALKYDEHGNRIYDRAPSVIVRGKESGELSGKLESYHNGGRYMSFDQSGMLASEGAQKLIREQLEPVLFEVIDNNRERFLAACLDQLQQRFTKEIDDARKALVEAETKAASLMRVARGEA